MKKVLFYSIITVSLSCLLFITLNKSEKKVNTEETASLTASDVYIIKAYDGKVAVFSDGVNSPIQVLDCKINSLPPDAVEALATGIKVTGTDELQRAIEAYD